MRRINTMNIVEYIFHFLLRSFETQRELIETAVEYEDGANWCFQKMEIPKEARHKPKFRLPAYVGEATVMVMSDLWWPDTIIDSILEHSNAYGKAHMGTNFKEISRAEILRFIAIYYYMGLVRCPAKTDYWRTENSEVWPTHPVTHRLKQTRYKVIWRCIHLTATTREESLQEDADAAIEINSDTSQTSEEHAVVTDRHEDAVDIDPQIELEDSEVVNTVWYEKAKPILDHVNTVSQKYCIHPSFAVSIDEQMKKFKGRSKQTVRMKNKPIKEGFKFWSISDSCNGYIYATVPSGRCIDEKIKDVVVSLVEQLPRRDTLKVTLGCDLGDQLIASYRPTLRVRRYWMAMMFHGFDIIRINSYLAFKDLNEGKPLSQKEYLAKFIEALLLRAHEEESRHTRATTRSNSPTHERKTKRFRQSKKNPSLPIDVFF